MDLAPEEQHGLVVASIQQSGLELFQRRVLGVLRDELSSLGVRSTTQWTGFGRARGGGRRVST